MYDKTHAYSLDSRSYKSKKKPLRNFRLTGKQVDKLTSKYALHHLLC